jgi:nitric oxide synthase-interacting protein
VAQKKEIRRQKERFEAVHQEEEEEKERVKEAVRQRVLHDFERGQLGLGIGHHLNKQAKDGGTDANDRESARPLSRCILTCRYTG